MNLEETIQEAVKSGKAVMGYNESVKFIKINSPKLIVIASNMDEKNRNEIEHSAKIAKIPVEIFSGSSKELGVACGKPFPISVLAIKR